MIFKLLSKKYAYEILDLLTSFTDDFHFNEIKNEIGINQSNLSQILSDFVKYRLVNRIERKKGNQVMVYYEGTQNAVEVLNAYKEFNRVASYCILEKDAFEKFFTEDIFKKITEIEYMERKKIAVIKPKFTLENDILGKVAVKMEPVKYVEEEGKEKLIGILDGTLDAKSEEEFFNILRNMKDLSNGNPVYLFSGLDLNNDTFERFFLIPVWEIKTCCPNLSEIEKWEVKSKDDIFNIMKEYTLNLTYLGTISIPGHTVHYYADPKTDELYAVSSDRIPKLLGKIIAGNHEKKEKGEFICSLVLKDGEILFDSNYAKNKEKSSE